MRSETRLKSITFWLFTLTVIFSVNAKLSGINSTEFNDGQIHNIDYAIDELVIVDYGDPGMQTTLNFLPGANIAGVDAWEDSKVSVEGGWIREGFRGFGNSHLSLTDGVIGATYINFYFEVYQYSQAIMSGGHLDGILWVRDYGQFTLSGGTIDHYFDFRGSSSLTIYGSNFEIAGTPVGYGEYSGIGHITGILDSGNVLNNDFYFYDNAKLILIPDPATLLLLGLGARLCLRATPRRAAVVTRKR
jgi:hypothetical protein